MAGYELDPYTQGIDQDLLAAMAAGTKAKSSLAGLNSSPLARQGLNLSQTPFAQMRGTRGASSAPTGLEALGSMLLRNKGSDQLNQMDAQAKLLRGEEAAGTIAEQQYALQKANIGANLTAQKEARVAGAKLTAAQLAAKAKVEAAGLKNQQKNQQTALAATNKFIERKVTDDREDALKKLTRDRDDAERDNVQKINPITGKEMTVGEDNQGRGYIDNKPIEEYSTWTDKETGGGKNGSFYKMTSKQQEAMKEISTNYATMDYMEETFKSEFGNTSGLPIINELGIGITKAAPIFSGAQQKAKTKWWQDYEREYELIERHMLFGSALTTGEKALWRAANITPNMDGAQIQASLRTQEMLKRKRGASERSSALARWGANKDGRAYIDNIFPEDVFYVDEEVQGEIDRAREAMEAKEDGGGGLPRTTGRKAKRDAGVAQSGTTKNIGGVSYEKRGNDWFPVTAP